MPCKFVPDITVGPVGAAELDHQPQLINLPHRGKDRHQLILKAVPNKTAVKFECFNSHQVPWNPVAVYLTTPAWWRASPVWRRSPENPLTLLLQDFVSCRFLQCQQPPEQKSLHGAPLRFEGIFNIVHLDKSSSSTTKEGVVPESNIAFETPCV